MNTNCKCQRCGALTRFFKMSFFNTEMICKPCEIEEEAHPKYPEAREREREEVLNGNYNFEGTGLPQDLRHGN